MPTMTRRRDKGNPDEAPKTHQEDPLLSLSEAGRQLGKSPNTIKRWILDGLLTFCRRPNGLMAVRQSQVDRLLKTLQITAGEAER